MNQTAGLLRTILAQHENPQDTRLNPNLSESDIVETIRIAIECLDMEQHATDESARLRAALETVARKAFATGGDYLGLPSDAWETVLAALGKKER